MSYLTVAIRKETGRLVYIDNDGKLSDCARDGDSLRLEYSKPYLLKPASTEATIPVARLPKTATIPTARVAAMSVGSVEEFIQQIGYNDEEFCPKEPEITIWMNFNKDGLALHEYVVGGEHIYQNININ